MRISTLAIAAGLACAAAPALAPAQDVPDRPKTENAQATQNAQDTQNLPNTPDTRSSPESPNNQDSKDRIPQSPPNRFTFNRVDGGFLRLDNKSGQIAFCSSHSVGWACQVVPEDRAALEKEIARLQNEVAGLKNEVAALRAPPPPRPPAELSPPADKNGDAKIKLPTSEDIERARAAIEDAWRRLVDMIVNFQKDMMRKG